MLLSINHNSLSVQLNWILIESIFFSFSEQWTVLHLFVGCHIENYRFFPAASRCFDCWNAIHVWMLLVGRKIYVHVQYTTKLHNDSVCVHFILRRITIPKPVLKLERERWMLLTFFIWFQLWIPPWKYAYYDLLFIFSKILPLNTIYQCDLAEKCSICSSTNVQPCAQ